VELAGGAITKGIVRLGDTVRRPAKPSSPSMREVLLHLEQAGFDAAPRWLGVDDEGRDVLTWIEGETFTERGRLHPFLDDTRGRILFSDEQVVGVMRLLRRYHDTFGGEVVCHGDFGPWNIVWRDGAPVGVIDFDEVHPGDPSEDVAYALRMFVGYGLVAGDVVARTRVALDAYGADFDVPSILAREYARAEATCRANGWHRQLRRLAVERAWLEANAACF
jgi:Ser/Thr protein kinase RdoA (MazF antagonist)